MRISFGKELKVQTGIQAEQNNDELMFSEIKTQCDSLTQHVC